MHPRFFAAAPRLKLLHRRRYNAGHQYRPLGFEALESRRLLTSVAGTVFEDLNRNGKWETSAEPVVSGVSVRWTGSYVAEIMMMRSDSETTVGGNYLLENIDVSNGNVAVTIVPGSLTPLSLEVTYPLANAPADSTTLDRMDPSRLPWASAGRLDGDADMDLVVVDKNNDIILVYLNQGDEFASAPATYTVGDQPIQVLVSDLDNDQDQDLVVAHNALGYQGVTVLVNNGSGAFSPGPLLTVIGFVTSIALVDVNADLKPEIVGIRPATDQILVWPNTSTAGSTSFAASPVLSSASSDPYSIVAAQLDASAPLELLLLDSVAHTVYRYDLNAAGQAVANGQVNIDPGVAGQVGDPMVLVAGDLNGDQRDDIAVARFRDLKVSILFNSGGQFTAANQVDALSRWHPVGLAVADVDGDGDKDIMVNTFNSPFGIIENLGATFSDAGNSPNNGNLSGLVIAAPAVADFNGDGVMDFAYANEPLTEPELHVDFGGVAAGQNVIRSSPDQNYTGRNFGVAKKVSPYRTSQGDYNGDGTVNAADLAVWRANLGQNVIGPGKSADSDSDRDVDGADFLRWQRQLGAAVSANPPAPQSDGQRAVILSMSLNDATSPRRGVAMVGDGGDRSIVAKSPSQIAAPSRAPTRRPHPGQEQEIESDQSGLPLEPLRADFLRALDEALAQSLPGLY